MKTIYHICLHVFGAEGKDCRDRNEVYARCAFIVICLELKIVRKKMDLARYLNLTNGSIHNMIKKFHNYKTDNEFYGLFREAKKRSKAYHEEGRDSFLMMLDERMSELKDENKALKLENEILKETKGLQVPGAIERLLIMLSSDDIQEFCETRVNHFLRMKLSDKRRYEKFYGHILNPVQA